MANADSHKSKMLLMLYSFAPLFFLIGLKHCDCGDIRLFHEFFSGLFSKDWSVIWKALNHDSICRLLILLLCTIWVSVSFLYQFVFTDIQKSGFSSDGKKVRHVQYTSDGGINFFVSYLLPLLMDLSKFQDVLAFIGILVMMVMLMWKSSLFYENPVLTILGYKTFTFSFTDGDDEYVGITRKKNIDTSRKIKSKLIADNVYFVYNE